MLRVLNIWFSYIAGHGESFYTSFTVDSFRGYWILMLKGHNTTVICKRLILLNYAKSFPRRKELTKKRLF